MNILMPAYYFTDDPRSGVETGFWNFAKHLAEKGNRIFIVTCSLDLVNETKKTLKDKNIHVYQIYNYKTHGLGQTEAFMTFVFSVFLRVFYKFDWIFIVDGTKTPFSHFKLGARLASRIIRPKSKETEFFFNSGDWLYDRQRKDLGEGWGKRKIPLIYRAFRFVAIRIWYKFFTVKESAENSDILFCEGKITLDYCRRVNRKNPVYLPLGIENYRFDKLECGFNSNGKFIFLFVGRILRMKGVYYLIDAFKQLAVKYSNIELWIIGHSFGEYKEKLLNDIVGFEDRIKILGERGRNDIVQYMKSCNVVVDSMIWANFSSVSLEALYCKKPLITPLLGNSKDFVKDGVSGFLVDSRDVTKLKRKMEYLFLNQDKAKEMGEKGYEFVKKYLTWDKVAQIVEDNLVFFGDKEKIKKINKKYENFDY